MPSRPAAPPPSLRIERITAADSERLGAPGVAAQIRGLVPGRKSVESAVAEIIAQVRTGGDAAVLDLTRRLDTNGADPPPLRVTPEELDAAIKQLPRDVVAGLQVTITNVAAVADATVGPDRRVTPSQGHTILLRELPVASAAVYVPGGRAPYPSTAVMGVVTARAAGVVDVCVCAPPAPDGDVHPIILGTCRLLGVSTVYRMGGAQAIAALAYGTETVDRVDVIVGPGNLYVQEAKRQLSPIVGIEGFAGPSELLVVMTAEADLQLVALDVLAQAEHGGETLVGVACPSPQVLDALEAKLSSLAPDRNGAPDRASPPPTTCVLVESPDLREALALANAFAPEHLELVGAEAEALAPLVQTAGCLFVGAESATAFGDYVAGSNHVLPTGGAARFSSTLSPRHFRRLMAEVRIGAAAAKLAAAGAPIARAEGFVVHAESMEARAGGPRRGNQAGSEPSQAGGPSPATSLGDN